jgi:UTP--glucose-1-phosphate uridylyltransferase
MAIIDKAVIPAAGLGTRMLPFTKEQPKEMLPIYYKGYSGAILVKPIIQCIFEQLFDIGIRRFCFIIGRSKRIIEDHFTIDEKFLELLKAKGNDIYYNELKAFYTKIEESIIFWVNQHIPKGFGHAVLLSESFIDNKPFIVHAGDVCIFSFKKHPLLRMLEVYETYGNEIDAILLVKRIKDVNLLKQHGIVIPSDIIPHNDNNIILIKDLIEKPKEPPSEFAIMPLYIFKPSIFKELKNVTIDKRGEIQLTDAIASLVSNGKKVIALEMLDSDIRIDVGMPDLYAQSINNIIERLI